MTSARMRCPFVALVFMLMPLAAIAEPIKLKLAFIASDRSSVYQVDIKPFIEAVNAEPDSPVKIELYSSGLLGKAALQQVQLVLDGTADIAFVVPSYTPERFPDNSIVGMPGLARDVREATLLFTRLVAAHALRGYEDFFVIGAFATEPQTFHMRPPVAALADLKGKRIGVGSPVQAAVLEKLGMLPVVLPISEISDAISADKLDGGLLSTLVLSNFNIARLVTHHYLLGIAPTMGRALLMNRKKFESLPQPAQEVIRKYSGEWAAARSIAMSRDMAEQTVNDLKSNPKRTVISASQSDLETAEVAFRSVTDAWLAEDARNPQLLKAAEAELAKLRSAQQDVDDVIR